jgi:putative acetyltransferase
MNADAISIDDWTEVDQLLKFAFAGSTFESTLVMSLRHAGRDIIERIIRQDGRIVAHLALSIAYRGPAPIGFHLAPVAVHPDYQRHGFGTSIVFQALAETRVAEASIFVLGDPRFYGRFGFRRVQKPSCSFDPGNQHFQALRWACDDEFTIGYEPEFQEAQPDDDANHRRSDEFRGFSRH